MATTPTTPSINQGALKKAISKQIPKPKQRKWRQIGAKAIGGDQGALARLTKRGLVKKGAGSGAGSGGSGASGTGTKVTAYKPPAITDEMLAKSPTPGATAGTYHDTITGLDVAANFGANPYHPGGGTAASAKPSQPTGKEIGLQPVGRRRTIKRLGKALKEARKNGDTEKAKRLHHHIKRLRNLHFGESLSRPSAPELKTEIQIARSQGNTKRVRNLQRKRRNLRRNAVTSALESNGGVLSSATSIMKPPPKKKVKKKNG